ncbi:MAG: hypothetical protein GY937_11385 [bacterium]|nr:hypothetical protein [bacterium]
MWGLRLTVISVRTFGRFLGVPLVLGVVSYFFATDRKGRAASRAYLERVHANTSPEPEWKPGLWQSFLHYREFAISIADRVGLWGGRMNTFQFAFHGREHFKPFLEEGRGTIVLGSHLGSFDAMRALGARDGVPVNVLMYTRHAPKINEIFREISPDVEVRVISAEPGSARATFEIKACIERGELVAILADRVPPSQSSSSAPSHQSSRVCHVDFLGGRAALPEAPFQLPAILGCPAVMIVALRSGPGRYEIHAEPLASDGERRTGAARARRATELAERYAQYLERYCVLAPLQWFNFYDFWAEGDPR